MILRLLRHKSRCLVCIRKALCVWVGIEIRLDEADDQTLGTHGDSVPSKSEQGDNNEEQIDNRKKA